MNELPPATPEQITASRLKGIDDRLLHVEQRLERVHGAIPSTLRIAIGVWLGLLLWVAIPAIVAGIMILAVGVTLWGASR